MRWVTIGTGAAMIGLGGCQPVAPPVIAPVPACDGAAYAPLVGSNAAAVDVVPGLDLRIVGPRTLVTLDYKPDRVNFRVNGAGIITSVDCG